MIYKDIKKYKIIIKEHALLRARERGIYPFMIEATVDGGKIKRFGKNYIRFTKMYKRGKICCIGEIVGSTIKIITVECDFYEKTIMF